MPKLGNRFSTIERLDPNGGPGNFSLIFRALDNATKKTVAIKVFHPGKFGDVYRLACFHREADLLGRYVGDRNFIQLVSPIDEIELEVKTLIGSPLSFSYHYYALELAECDLGHLIATRVLDYEQRLIAFHQVCRAVQRLHLDGITNRDIKPPNVLMRKKDVVCLSDLGTARDMSPSIPPLIADYGTLWPGDMRYAPPEMLAGLFGPCPELTFGADQFALGAILFELFTGVTLASVVFDASFATDLATAMQYVKPERRRSTYDDFVVDLERAHPLPMVESVNPDIPPSIRRHVNALYKDLCRLDYRRRLAPHASVFRQTRAAVLTLRHEQRENLRRAQRKLGGRPGLVPPIVRRIVP